jgi:hypothetical protein
MDDLLTRRRSHSHVTFLACRGGAREHEIASQRHVAERLAALLGCAFAEARDETHVLRGPLGYAVPNDTLDSIERAHSLGIRSAADLYGGVVPHPFVATKAITHPLIASDAAAPAGWQPSFAKRVRDVVLPGFSAFSIDDARAAGRRLLRGGHVRVKLASGIGGAGQSVARNESELDAQLGTLGTVAIAQHGVVLERNLAELRTHSVGVLQFGGQRTSYFGTQRTTRNRHGHEVYGGSSLTLARGGLDGLAPLTTDAGVQRAIAQAAAYHAAALESFDGMFASRCNYDIAEGRDAAGADHSGVLEQSWRLGGASGAEVAALEAFRDDPSRTTVRASTTELHRSDVALPAGATLYYSGVDPHLGPIVKYAEVDADARA